MKKYDALIIGAGISGLTSAILLAREGLSVAVVEKHYKVGGYLHSFKRFGIEFDTGGHYIGAMEEGGAFRKMLEYLQVFDENHYRPMAKDHFDRFIINDKEYSFSHSHKKTIENLSHDFPHEEKGIKNYFIQLEKVASLMGEINFKASDINPEVFKWMETSLQETVESFIQDPTLKSILYSYCTLHGVSPQDVSFAPHAVITDTLIKGAYTFQNSGDDLAKKFESECKALGVDFYLREEVSQIHVHEKEVQTVKTNKNEFSCQYLISSIHPKLTFSLLDKDPTREVFKKRLRKMKESKSFVAAYIRLKDKTSFKADTNYYFFKGDVENLFDKADPFNPHFLYLCRPGRSNEEDYKLKHSFMTVHIPCDYSYVEEWEKSLFGKRPVEYKEFKAKLEEVLISELSQIDSSLPDLIDKIELSTPLTNTHYNGSIDGSAYGVYHSMENTGFKGLTPKTKIKNLFLTGQNTSFPGLQSSCNAAFRTVSALLKSTKIFDSLR